MYCGSVENKDAIDLIKEYSPSLNTKRFQNKENPQDAVLENFVKICEEETQNARLKFRFRENVRYGGEDDNQLVDIYYVDQEKDTPIFVYIHGGFWQALDKNSSGILAQPLLDAGYRFLAVGYNLCSISNKSLSLVELTQQIKNFYCWLLEYAAKTNARSITICGHSAGAYLALQLFNPNVITFANMEHIASLSLFLISGVYDLRELHRLECVNKNNILRIDSESAIRLSPVCWAIKDEVVEFYQRKNLKLCIIVAENDSKTFIEQSRRFANVMENLFPTNFNILSNYDHFDIIEEMVIKDSTANKCLHDFLMNIRTQ